MGFGLSSLAQTELKNNVYVGYSVYEGSRSYGGNISAQGFDISYSRYITNRIYGDVSYGKMNFEGRNSNFFLDPEEMDHFNMTVFTLGGGYDLIQSKQFVLSGELAYQRQATHELIGILQDSQITIRET